MLDVTAGGVKTRVLVKDGFAEVDPTRLTVLAQSAHNVEDLTGSTLTTALSVAEAELAAATGDEALMTANTLVTELKRIAAKAA